MIKTIYRGYAKRLRLLTDDTRYRRLPLDDEILLATTVFRQELYIIIDPLIFQEREMYQ